MKILVFGLGYVGLTGTACALKSGHRVFGVDTELSKVEAVKAGRSPIQEPGIAELLEQGVAEDRLDAGIQFADEVADADLAIVCVGTPSQPDGSHNMSYIAKVSNQIAEALAEKGRAEGKGPLTVAFRSTMRPGSIDDIIWPVFTRALGEDLANEVAEIVYNPEFLREATAVRDYFSPPKIVIGTRDGQPNATLDELFEGIEAPRFHCVFRDSEFVKFMDNSFHALKVAFANEAGRVATALGVSAQATHEIFVSDTKLNVSPYYLRPGGAFGGSCLPKDVRALSFLGKHAGEKIPVIDALIKSNEAHKDFMFRYATEGLDPGARVLMLGLTFKAATDDLRESPNVDLAQRLLKAGFALEIHDPMLENARIMGQNLGYALAHLPAIEKLLVSKDAMAERTYDRVLDTNGLADNLPAFEADVIGLGTLK